MRLLIAEDDRMTADTLAKRLREEHYAVDVCYNGTDALDYLTGAAYDVAVMDIMMPLMDGITALKAIRASGNPIPILLLTAKAEVDDRVLGLDSGANYYLTKPFDTKELLAAIRAITRAPGEISTTLTFGNVSLDRSTFTLSSPTGSFRLANKEFQMMETFMANPRHVLSAERFMEKIWGLDNEAEINVVWVYISYLRKKLSALDANIYIKVSRNIGYSLEEIV